MLKALLPAVIFIPAFAAQSAPTSWICQNTAAEISCGDGACEVSTDAFTPMSITVATDASVSFCAYTGCWEGRAETMTTTGTRQNWTGTDLRWSQTPDAPGVTGSLTIDTKTKVGTVLIGGFAQPVLCEGS